MFLKVGDSEEVGKEVGKDEDWGLSAYWMLFAGI